MNIGLIQLLFVYDTGLVSLHCPLQRDTFPDGPAALGMVLPPTSMGCVSPHCSFVLPVPFPAMHCVAPELLMPPVSNLVAPHLFFFPTSKPLVSSELPFSLKCCALPLPLLCNACAHPILPFTLGHSPSPPCVSQLPQYSLKQAP